MVEEKSKKEGKIEFDVGWYKTLLEDERYLLEDKRYLQKYGLSKEEFEKSLVEDLKFSNSFWVVSDHLQSARSLISEHRVKECRHFIERAKYVLRGCKE